MDLKKMQDQLFFGAPPRQINTSKADEKPHALSYEKRMCIEKIIEFPNEGLCVFVNDGNRQEAIDFVNKAFPFDMVQSTYDINTKDVFLNIRIREAVLWDNSSTNEGRKEVSLDFIKGVILKNI